MPSLEPRLPFQRFRRLQCACGFQSGELVLWGVASHIPVISPDIIHSGLYIYTLYSIYSISVGVSIDSAYGGVL